MGFLIGAVVALLVVFLLTYITIKKPTFGKVVIVLALLMIVVAVFFYFQKDDRVAEKKHLIPLEQVELSEVLHHWSYGNYYKLTADIKNNSERYRLQSIVFQVSLFQCPDSPESTTHIEIPLSECSMVLQREHKVDTRLAAQQTGEIGSYFLLDADKLKSEKALAINVEALQWKIELIGANARK